MREQMHQRHLQCNLSCLAVSMQVTSAAKVRLFNEGSTVKPKSSHSLLFILRGAVAVETSQHLGKHQDEREVRANESDQHHISTSKQMDQSCDQRQIRRSGRADEVQDQQDHPRTCDQGPVIPATASPASNQSLPLENQNHDHSFAQHLESQQVPQPAADSGTEAVDTAKARQISDARGLCFGLPGVIHLNPLDAALTAMTVVEAFEAVMQCSRKQMHIHCCFHYDSSPVWTVVEACAKPVRWCSGDCWLNTLHAFDH